MQPRVDLDVDRDMHRRVLLTLAFLALSGCCGTPADPSDPGSSKQAERVDAWFDLLRNGKDEEAYALLRGSDQPTGPGISLEGFVMRVDALELRKTTSIEWTRVHYLDQEAEGPLGLIGRCLIENNVEMEAELTTPSGVHTFSAMWIPGKYGGLWRVKVDEQRLIPVR